MPVQPVNTMRAVLAVAVLVSAAVHLYVYVQGFSGIPVIGPLFLANVIGGVVIAAAVGLWRHWIPAVLAAGFGLTTVVAYWISVIHGLFGVREVTGGWPEIVAESAEYVAVALGATTAILLWRQPNSRRIDTSDRHQPARGPSDPAEAALTKRAAMPSDGAPQAATRTPPRGRTG